MQDARKELLQVNCFIESRASTCIMAQAAPSQVVSGPPPAGKKDTAKFSGPALAGNPDTVVVIDLPSSESVLPSVVARAGTTSVIEGAGKYENAALAIRCSAVRIPEGCRVRVAGPPCDVAAGGMRRRALKRDVMLVQVTCSMIGNRSVRTIHDEALSLIRA